MMINDDTLKHLCVEEVRTDNCSAVFKVHISREKMSIFGKWLKIIDLDMEINKLGEEMDKLIGEINNEV